MPEAAVHDYYYERFVPTAHRPGKSPTDSAVDLYKTPVVIDLEDA